MDTATSPTSAPSPTGSPATSSRYRLPTRFSEEPKRILIVDDDPQFGVLAKLTLEETGIFDVTVQTDSNEAISTAREFLPDLILLDIVMPGLDGGDVQALLKNDPILCDIPVLIVSAIVAGEDTDDDGIVYSGGDTLLPKTVDPKAMIEKIEQKLAEVI